MAAAGLAVGAKCRKKYAAFLRALPDGEDRNFEGRFGDALWTERLRFVTCELKHAKQCDRSIGRACGAHIAELLRCHKSIMGQGVYTPRGGTSQSEHCDPQLRALLRCAFPSRPVA